MSRRLRLVLGAVSVVAVLVFGYVGFAMWQLTRFDLEGRQIPDQVPFDQAAWLDHGFDNRLAMKDAAALEIQGTDPEGVLEILGEPSHDYSDSDSWWYYLGPEPGAFAIDSLWLVVEVREGMVMQVHELTD